MTLYPNARITAAFRQVVESWGMERSGIGSAYHPRTRAEATLVWCFDLKRWAIHYWEWSRGAEMVAYFIGPDANSPNCG